MLSGCRISGGAVSGTFLRQAIPFICPVRPQRRFEPPRHRREGVGWARGLPIAGQDRRTVSGALNAELFRVPLNGDADFDRHDRASQGTLKPQSDCAELHCGSVRRRDSFQ